MIMINSYKYITDLCINIIAQIFYLSTVYMCDIIFGTVETDRKNTEN